MTTHPTLEGLPPLSAAPEPFEYNPSSWKQRVMISLLALVAFFISVYMGLYQWGLISAVWDPVFGNQSMKVLDSDVSKSMERAIRIPDAMLGAVAYLGDVLFAMAGSTRRWQYRPWLVIIFGIDVIPLGIVSAILVMMQAFVVGNWCFLCLVTAVISLALVFLAYDEVWSCLIYLRRVWKKSRDLRLLANTFFGRPSEIAHEVGAGMINERNRRKS